MRFKRSVHFTTDCFASVFKLLLYRVITGLIFYSLIFLILHLGLSFIMRSEELATLQGMLPEFVRTVATGDSAELTAFQESVHTALENFANLLGANMGSIIGSIIGVCAMYILQRFTNGLAIFAVGSTVNDRMSSYAHTRFANAYFLNIGKAALYQLVYVPLAFIYDLLSVLACWFLFFYIPTLFPAWEAAAILFSIGLTITVMVCLQALKLTIISAWMPAMIADGKSVLGALKETAEVRKDFTRRFGGYLTACYLIVFVNASFAVFTAGSGLLITVPLSFIFLIVMQFVNYYELKGKKYFTAKDVISGPDDDMPEQAE